MNPNSCFLVSLVLCQEETAAAVRKGRGELKWNFLKLYELLSVKMAASAFCIEKYFDSLCLYLLFQPRELDAM